MMDQTRSAEYEILGRELHEFIQLELAFKIALRTQHDNTNASNSSISSNDHNAQQQQF